MKPDEITRKVLKKYVTGEASHPVMSPITKRMLEVFLYAEDHMHELEALRVAEEYGDREKLAEIIETKGEPRTPDAKAYVAAFMRGTKRKPGNKRKEEDVVRRIRLFMEVQGHMHTHGENQTDALRRAVETRTSFVETAFEAFAAANAGEEPVGETREFLDQLSKEAESGLSDDFKKGRAEMRELLEALGFDIGPALQTRVKTDKPPATPTAASSESGPTTRTGP
jgi:hypothetical protein